MQRTGELFGVRASVWVGAFVVVGILCVAVQNAQHNADPSDRADSIPSTGRLPLVAETVSPARSGATFPSNGFDPAFAKLLQQFSDPDANIRLTAVESLEKLQMPNDERVSLLTACLSDADPRIRAHAALRLGSFRVAAIDAVPALKQLAESETDDVVRARVKDALYNIRMYDYSPLMRDL